MDSRNCQTYTASPAEPGGLPASLGGDTRANTRCLPEFRLELFLPRSVRGPRDFRPFL